MVRSMFRVVNGGGGAPRNFEDLEKRTKAEIDTQYGHSQSEKKLGVGDKYHRSIKVHT